MWRLLNVKGVDDPDRAWQQVLRDVPNPGRSVGGHDPSLPFTEAPLACLP